MKRGLIRIITLIYLILLSYVTLRPISVAQGTGMAIRVINNIIHIPAYGLLAYLVIKSLSGFKYVYIASFLITVAFGILNEYLQLFIPGRFASGLDVLLNSTGSLIVVFLYAKRYTLYAKR